MTDNEQKAIFHFGEGFNQKEAHWAHNKNLRDVLIHLYEWHQLLLNWVKSNQAGETKLFLPEPYTWKTYSDMNVKFCENHQDAAYSDAKQMFLGSHKACRI